jgi:hypothetical protein
MRLSLSASIISLGLLLFLAGDTGADDGATTGGDTIAPSAKIGLEALDWLEGRWVGEAFGGVCEEVWTQASGGSMVGTFKLTSNDQVSFYEIMTITIEAGAPVLKLKHFNADLTGWEERDEVIEFQFERMSPDKIEFHGLTYENTAPGTLRIVVQIGNGEGGVEEQIIECHRLNE